MEFPTLYKEDRFWKIYITTSKTSAEIHTEFGKIGGKISHPPPQIVSPTSTKSALERAKILATTKWQNKITSGGYKQKLTKNTEMCN